MTYIPYPSLRIRWHPHQKGFHLSLPWLSLEIEVNPEDLSWIYDATDTLNVPTNEKVQKFFQLLSDYTAAYVAPRKLKEVPEPLNSGLNSIPIKSIPLESPLSFAQWIMEDSSLTNLFRLKPSWEWDTEEICRVSRMEETPFYDPVTVITFLRGLILEADAKTDQYRLNLSHILDRLRVHNENSFFTFMIGMLRHTHYITQKFQEYTPAILTNFAEATEEITQFLKEEKGHDKLMEHSLKALGCDHPENIFPALETRLLMEIFNKTIETSPLAFTAMIGIFEGGDYGEVDPLAEVLKKSSVPDSALGYQRHFEINKEENHNQMIYTLAQKLPLQSYESVIFTARTLELACYISTFSDQGLASKAGTLLSGK
jgi:hypothetical protein